MRNGHAVMRVRLDGHYITRSPKRLMYASVISGIPAGQVVTNTCGTKNCCNPAHLKLGGGARELMSVAPSRAAA